MEKAKKSTRKKITDTVKKIANMRAEDIAGAIKKKLKLKPSVDQDAFFRRVQEKAYELYVQRGCQCGSDLQDWHEAEKLVRAEIKAGR